MIRFENVSKKFQEIYAIKEISLTIDRGEKFVLLGTSGSGKSTVLKHINFLLQASEGRVFIENEDIRFIDKIRLRRNTGYIIQDAGLFPHYTVKQNIGLIPQLNGTRKESITQKVRDLMVSLKLEASLINKYPSELSGGQRQRVGIARALAGDPDMLLLDEALSALDPITKIHIQDDFIHLDELKSKTMVWVTHDIKEAFKVGDRICLMDQGIIQQTGCAQDFLLRPKNSFVRNFFSSDRMSYLIQSLTLHDLLGHLGPVTEQETKTSLEFISTTQLSQLFDMRDLPEQIGIFSSDQEKLTTTPEAIFKALIATSNIN